MTATVLTGKSKIELFQMRQQLMALSMEIKGMRHSSGLSMSKHIKNAHGIKGRKKVDVYKAFHALIVLLEDKEGIPPRPLNSTEKEILGEEK